MKRILLISCWAVVGIIVVFLLDAVSPLGRLLHFPGDFRTFELPLGVLGALLVTLTALGPMNRLPKVFLIMAGISTMGWPISLSLHTLLFHFFPAEPFTYVLFFYVCPLVFIFSLIGAISTGLRELYFSRKSPGQLKVPGQCQN